MSVSHSIIEWLKTFDEERIKSINTDIQPARVNSYALVKNPIINKKTSITGKITATEHYTLMARLDSQDNMDCKENTEWGEQLEKWIETKNKNKEFPAVEDARVEKISVTTPFYMGSTETNESLYQLTISIMYRKE